MGCAQTETTGAAVSRGTQLPDTHSLLLHSARNPHHDPFIVQHSVHMLAVCPVSSATKWTLLRCATTSTVDGVGRALRDPVPSPGAVAVAAPAQLLASTPPCNTERSTSGPRHRTATLLNDTDGTLLDAAQENKNDVDELNRENWPNSVKHHQNTLQAI